MTEMIRPGSIDAYLDPPDEPERYVPVDSAPYAAILRAVADWLDGGSKERVMQTMIDALKEEGCEDVLLTESEWEAHGRAIIEQMQEP